MPSNFIRRPLQISMRVVECTLTIAIARKERLIKLVSDAPVPTVSGSIKRV